MRSVTVRGLTAAHGPHEVLHGIDLHVPAGSTTAVLGPSGCGKTTLLRVLAGFMAPTGGEVLLDDEVVSSTRRQVAPEHRGIGYVRQDGGLFPHLDVGQNIGFGWGAARRRRREGVDELLELVGLDPTLSRRRPHQLSGGQQQRVALARALALEPAVVLLDEPFTALDTALRASTRDAVASALSARGATAVLVTHDQGEALSFADQIAIMRGGRLSRVGTPREVYSSPSDLEEAAFLGDAIRLPATLRRHPGGLAATCTFGELPVRGEVDAADGAAVELLVRPEQVALGDRGTPATVSRVRYFGHDALVDLELGHGDPVTCRLLGPVVPGPGEAVHLSVRGEVPAYPAGRARGA